MYVTAERSAAEIAGSNNRSASGLAVATSTSPTTPTTVGDNIRTRNVATGGDPLDR